MAPLMFITPTCVSCCPRKMSPMSTATICKEGQSVRNLQRTSLKSIHTHRGLNESHFHQQRLLEHRQPGAPEHRTELHEPGGLVGVTVLGLLQCLRLRLGGQQLLHVACHFAGRKAVADLADAFTGLHLAAGYDGQHLDIEVRRVVVRRALGAHTANGGK